MPVDHFAALRRGPAPGVTEPTDEAALSPLFHTVPPDVVQENDAESTVYHPFHAFHPEMTRRKRWEARTAELQRDWAMPADWASGVAAIEQMARPRAAISDRWDQVVDDSTVFATRWHQEAIGLGWGLADVFGYDPDNEGSHMGLVLHIRGGRCLPMGDGSITVRRDQHSTIYRRGLVDADSALLWTLNRKVNA